MNTRENLFLISRLKPVKPFLDTHNPTDGMDEKRTNLSTEKCSVLLGIQLGTEREKEREEKRRED